MFGCLGVRCVRSFLREVDVQGLAEHVVARAIDDDRIGIGRQGRTDDRVDRALTQRVLEDLTTLDRNDKGAHQPLQPAAFEFAGKEIADFDLEVMIVGALAEELLRSEEHTSELQSLMRSSSAVFCFNKKKTKNPYLQ